LAASKDLAKVDRSDTLFAGLYDIRAAEEHQQPFKGDP
jgi:hypothetical protein